MRFNANKGLFLKIKIVHGYDPSPNAVSYTDSGSVRGNRNLTKVSVLWSLDLLNWDGAILHTIVGVWGGFGMGLSFLVCSAKL